MSFVKELLPLKERVNIPSQLRALRGVLRDLTSKEKLTPEDAIRKQRVEKAIADLLKKHVYLVSDCDIECSASLTSRQTD